MSESKILQGVIPGRLMKDGVVVKGEYVTAIFPKYYYVFIDDGLETVTSLDTGGFRHKNDGYTFEPQRVEVLLGEKVHDPADRVLVAENENQFCTNRPGHESGLIVWCKGKFSYRPIPTLPPTIKLDDGRVFNRAKHDERLAGLQEVSDGDS